MATELNRFLSENEIYIITAFGIMIIGSFLYIMWDVFEVNREDFKSKGLLYIINKMTSRDERIRVEIGIDRDIWSNLTFNEKEVMKNIYFRAKSNGVKFKLVNKEKIVYPSELETGGIDYVSGYFLGDEYGSEPELAVAIGGRKWEWFLILLHESSHMDQWLEKCPSWVNATYFKGEDCDVYDLMSQWIQGKEYEKNDIERIIMSCIDCELDCEKRTVNKIKEFNLNHIDYYEYTQKANSYIGFYGAIYKKRKWYKNAPYKDQNVWMRMPKVFLVRDKYFDIEDRYLNIYDQYCF